MHCLLSGAWLNCSEHSMWLPWNVKFRVNWKKAYSKAFTFDFFILWQANLNIKNFQFSYTHWLQVFLRFVCFAHNTHTRTHRNLKFYTLTFMIAHKDTSMRSSRYIYTLMYIYLFTQYIQQYIHTYYIYIYLYNIFP